MDLLTRYDRAIRIVFKEIYSFAPDYLVALARKGPRLVELCVSRGYTNGFDPKIVLTDRCLPFLPSDFVSGKKVALFDDIAVYGSTLRSVQEYLEGLGASVRTFAIAINKDQLRTSLVQPIYALGLTFKQSSTFNDVLARSFAELCKPLDTDHPILTAHSLHSLDQVVNKLRSRGITTDWVSETSEPEKSVYRATIHLPHPGEECPLNPESTYDGGVCKIRLFSRGRLLRIVPIRTFAWHESIGPVIPYDRSPERQIWKELVNKMDSYSPGGNFNSSEWRAYRLYSLAHFWAGLVLLRSWWDRSGLQDAVGVSIDNLMLDETDLRYSFGPVLAECVLADARSLFREPKESCREDTIELSRSGPVYPYEPTTRHNVLLERLKGAKVALSHGALHADEAISSLLNLSYLKHERRERRLSLYRSRRLSVGLTLSEILAYLEGQGISFQDCELSIAVDRLVDSGSIVPQFILTDPDTNLWARAYRYGENGYGTPSNKGQYFLAFVLDELHSQWKFYIKRKKRVSEFLLEKLIAILMSTRLRNRGRPSVENRTADLSSLPFRLDMDNYGVRIIPTERFREETLLEWAEGLGVVEVDRSEKKTVLNINVSDRWRERHPSENSPLDDQELLPEMSGLIRAVLAYISGERNQPISGQMGERLLALSTCGKQEGLISALAVLPKLAFKHNRYNLTLAFRNWEAFIESTDEQTRALAITELKTLLAELAGQLQQLDAKVAVFKEVDQLRTKLASTFWDGTAPYRQLEPFARKYLQYLLNSDVGPENRSVLRRLIRFSQCVRAFISVLRTVFSESNLIVDSRSPDKQRPLKDTLDRFVDLVTKCRMEFVDLPLDLPSVIEVSGSLIPAEDRSLFVHLRSISERLEAVYDGYVSHLGPSSAKTPVIIETVMLYDLSDSSGLSSQDRIATLTKLQDGLEGSLHSGELSFRFERNDDDGNWLRVESPVSALIVAVRLIVLARIQGVSLRIAACSTRETMPFVDTDNTDMGWSTAIPLCTRIQEFSKKDQPVNSICVVSDYIRSQILEIGGAFEKSQFTEMKDFIPRGDTLPAVRIYHFRFEDNQTEDFLV